MGKLHLALDRAHAGTAFDLADKIVDAKLSGIPINEVVAAEIVDRATDRYQKHIRAALARAGIEIDADEKITAAVLLREINSKTGIEIEAWTPEAVTAAVSARVSAKMSDVLGVDVEGVKDAESLKAALIDGAKEAVASGRANALVSKSMIKKLRMVATIKGAGIDQDEARKRLGRIYQKRYRRTHKEVWVSGAGEVGGE